MSDVLFKGIEWRRRLTVTEVSGARTNLTGKAVVLQLRRRPGGAVLLERTVGDGITLLDQDVAGTKGQATVVIGADLTAGLETESHSVAVLVDDQVVLKPTKVSVREL